MARFRSRTLLAALAAVAVLAAACQPTSPSAGPGPAAPGTPAAGTPAASVPAGASSPIPTTAPVAGTAAAPGRPTATTSTATSTATSTSTSTTATSTSTTAASAAGPTAAAPGTGSGGSPGSAPAPPQNLLRASQASFDGSTGGWVVENGTAAAAPDPAGGWQLAVSATSSQNVSAWSGLPADGGMSAATPGRLYSGSATVTATGTPVEVAPVLAFSDASGTVLSTAWGQGSKATSTPLPLAPAAALAPPGTVGVSLGLIVYSTTAGPAVAVHGPWLTGRPPAAPAPLDGPLHVVGNQILDARGRPVDLRGVVLNGLQSSADPAGVDGAAIADARAWGATMIRVPLGEQLWLSTSCRYDPSYVDAVDAVVHAITSRGMLALLDLHYSSLGSGCPVGSPPLMADAPDALTFWRQVAARYAGNPLVAFDLFNEPHNISAATWLDGGPVTSGPVSFTAAGMQQMADTVRSTGATNLIFVSGNDWANQPPTTLVRGGNIVYAVHDYTCPTTAPPTCANPNPDDPSPILDQWVPLSASVPVVVTEFGWPSAYQGTYNANVIAFAQAHGWGWSAYTWTKPNTGPWSLVAAEPSGAPAVPTPAGMPVLLALDAGS